MTDNQLDGTGEALETLPENDAPALPPGMTAEQAMLLRIVGEKAQDITFMVGALGVTNQVEEGELQPYDAELLSDATVLFKIAFAKLSEAIGGPFAR